MSTTTRVNYLSTSGRRCGALVALLAVFGCAATASAQAPPSPAPARANDWSELAGNKPDDAKAAAPAPSPPAAPPPAAPPTAAAAPAPAPTPAPAATPAPAPAPPAKTSDYAQTALRRTNGAGADKPAASPAPKPTSGAADVLRVVVAL